MRNEKNGVAMPHGWVEDVLMDVMTYCAMNGLDSIADAIGPALMAANALTLPQAPPLATHKGAPRTTQ